MIDEQANIEQRNAFNETPLVSSAFQGHNEAVKLLLEAKADTAAYDSCGYSALHWAVRRQAPEMIQLLLDSGADPNARDEDGRTALHIVRYLAMDFPFETYKDVIKMLLKASANSELLDKDERRIALNISKRGQPKYDFTIYWRPDFRFLNFE